MKIRADEHVSPKILQAVRLLCLRQGWEISHVRDEHSEKTADETWLSKFANDGGQAILTGDARILGRPHQLVAIRDTGLISVVLSKDWTKAKRHEQAANIIFWWPRLEQALENSGPGDCWPLPFSFDQQPLNKKVINYEKAAEALKKPLL